MLGVALDAVSLYTLWKVPSSRRTSGWSRDGSVTQQQTRYPLDQEVLFDPARLGRQSMR